MSAPRIGFLGGTFNPIHFGHLRAAEEVRAALALERVLFVPSHIPPLKGRDVASPQDRMDMVKLAVAGNPAFAASDIEIAREGVSYTADTVDAICGACPGHTTVFIVGIDAFVDLHLWKDPERLTAGTDFAVIGRPGWSFARLAGSPFLRMPGESEIAALDQGELTCVEARLASGRSAWLTRVTPLGISSTAIREALRRGESVSYLLPREVESFIMSHNIYAS